MPDSIDYSGLTLDQYQQESRKTAIYPAIGGREIYPALGLANEAGEVLGKIKKIYRDLEGRYRKEDLDSIEAELGDVLWYLSQLSYELGLSLEAIGAHNLEKLRSRAERGALRGSGDKR